ncbi:MAG: ABC transporter substrate-binding protein [Deltaproteobacteria bacterium]|nr:ABC transporter substrate-binding protein [Deltaproteobacteria bacterium]
MKKSIWLISFIFLFSLLGISVASAKPIVGLLFPISGAFSAMGTDMKQGAELAIEEINAKGGVLGKKAEVMIGDDELKPPVALRKYKEMVDGEGIKVIGGTLSGGVSVAVNEWACKNKVLYMAFCWTSMPLGKEFCGYGFVSGMIPYQGGVATAKYAFRNLGKSWMSVTQDYRFGHDQLQAWMVTSEKMGGKFLGNIYSPMGQVDYSAHIPRIVATNPDILVINVYGQSMDALIKQISEADLHTKKIKFITPKSHLTTIKGVGAVYNENFYGAHSFYWTMQDQFPKAKPFVEAYGKKHGVPPSQDSEGGYTGTRSLLEAINKAGTATDVNKLIKTLEGFKMDYNKGPEEYRACDHMRTTSMVIVRGIGAKASGWNYGDVVANLPASETLESCENNRKDVYGKVKLPGK